MAKQQEKMATYQLFVARCFTPPPSPPTPKIILILNFIVHVPKADLVS
jgi:hypothetical protein